MGRPPCCDKSNVKRGLWTAEEDAKILAYVSRHGIGNWTLVPKKAGLNRCGKSCRLRWTNYLRPDLKHESFTPQEEDVIISLHKLIGPRWSLIARHLPGRTDNDVKNYWNTKLRKKLSKLGIDPITHKPISQVLSDYGNINNFPNAENMKNILSPKIEPSSITNGLQDNCMVRKPMIEQVQDYSAATGSISWDILAESQISNFNFIQPSFSTSSCSSSSPPTAFSQPSTEQSSSFQASQSQIAPTCPSSWSEFLLSNPVIHENFQPQEEHKFPGMSPTSSSTITHKEISHGKANGYSYSTMNHASASSASSFVDAILDRDSELRSQFPELLDGSFDY